MDKFVLSVFELNTYVSDRLYMDPFLEEVWVRGEIGDFNVNRGVAYFVLTDGQASVDCMMFDYEDSAYADMLLEGQAVMLRGDISIYRKNGRFRIVAEQIELTGLGELYESFNRLREKLEKAGVFAAERKRSIPGFPARVGIVTSREGAVIQDIMNIIGRRNPLVKMTLYPVKVQGADAPEEISAGIRYLNEHTDADVLIVGRGGGAAEDLFAFNDERVVMEIYRSRIPVISAVGHESDYTLADMAADLRAPTPSAAAELAAPVKADIEEKLAQMRMRMMQAVRERLMEYESAAALYKRQISYVLVSLKMEHMKEALHRLRDDIRHFVEVRYRNTVAQYRIYNTELSNMNPDEVFERGYSIVTKNGKRIKSAAQLQAGDHVDIVFKDGKAGADVKEVV